MTFYADLLKLKCFSQNALTNVFWLFLSFSLVAFILPSHLCESGLLRKAHGTVFCRDTELQSCLNSSLRIILIHIVHKKLLCLKIFLNIRFLLGRTSFIR